MVLLNPLLYRPFCLYPNKFIRFPPINLSLIDLADLKYSFTVKPECSRPKSHAGEKYHMHSNARKMEA